MAQDRAKGLSALRRQRCRLVFLCTVYAVEVHPANRVRRRPFFSPWAETVSELGAHPGRAERALAARLTAARRRRRVAAK